MNILLAVLALLFAIVLIVVASAQPLRVKTSRFEMSRRMESGDKLAVDILKRDQLLDDFLTVRQVAESILLVFVGVFTVLAFSWWIGLILVLLVAVFYRSIASFDSISNWSQRLYKHFRRPIIKFLKKFPRLITMMRGKNPINEELPLGSIEELKHLIDLSGSVISDRQAQIIERSLEFENKTVGSLMLPREKIVGVPRKELLGPLVLDDLHKLGRDRLPVIDGDIDHIVGLVDIKSLLTLDKKRSLTAEKAMSPYFSYIQVNQKLKSALDTMQENNSQMLVVTDNKKHTVGLISLSNIVAALFGEKNADSEL